MFELRLISGETDISQLIQDIFLEKDFALFVKYCVKIYSENATYSIPKSFFRPDEIKSILPYISINELISYHNIQIRILGSELELIFGGHEMRGANALDYLPPQNVEPTAYFYKTASDNNLVSFLVEDLKLANGKQYKCTTLGLPMCDTEGMNRYRIAVSKLEFNPKEFLEPSDFQVTQTKLHDLRFVHLPEFVSTVNRAFLTSYSK